LPIAHTLQYVTEGFQEHSNGVQEVMYVI